MYIVAAITCTMMTMKPAFVIVSFICASMNSIRLNGWKKYFAGLRLLSVLFIVIVVFNPLTNHRGATTMFRLLGDPVTLEATVFGLCAGGMLVSAFIWFQCYQKLITHDKFLFLFARIAPVSAMVVSMVLRFIPVTGRHYREITEARSGLLDEGGTNSGNRSDASRRAKSRFGFRPATPEFAGRQTNLRSDASKRAKSRSGSIRNLVRTFGVLMSLSMEGSIETAASMRARGYGAGKRTFFSAWHLRIKDFLVMCCIAALFGLSITGMTFVSQDATFFPQLVQPRLTGYFCVTLTGYAAMLLLPLILEVCARVWLKTAYRPLRKHDGDH